MEIWLQHSPQALLRRCEELNGTGAVGRMLFAIGVSKSALNFIDNLLRSFYDMASLNVRMHLSLPSLKLLLKAWRGGLGQCGKSIGLEVQSEIEVPALGVRVSFHRCGKILDTGRHTSTLVASTGRNIGASTFYTTQTGLHQLQAKSTALRGFNKLKHLRLASQHQKLLCHI